MLWTYELVMVNYCDLHIAVTDIPLCLWNTGAPLAGNTGFICPLSRSVSTKQSGLHSLWATNCVVNQTGYYGPLYASRHQTSLWRCQHIYSVQFPQTGWLSGRVSDLRSKNRRFEPRPWRCCATTLGKLFTPHCLIHAILHEEDCELLIKSKIK